MTFLRSALRLAHRHQRIPYLPYVPTAGPGGVRKGFVDVELFDKIHAKLSAPYADMAEFGYLTGWRYQEVCGLELAWVFLADAEIRLPETKNGDGRVIVLEITTPERPPLSWFFRMWFDHLVPLMGRVAGDPDAYSYLPSSVRRFPSPRDLAARMAAAGMTDVRWILTAGGIIAIHSGTVT